MDRLPWRAKEDEGARCTSSAAKGSVLLMENWSSRRWFVRICRVFEGVTLAYRIFRSFGRHFGLSLAVSKFALRFEFEGGKRRLVMKVAYAAPINRSPVEGASFRRLVGSTSYSCTCKPSILFAGPKVVACLLAAFNPSFLPTNGYPKWYRRPSLLPNEKLNNKCILPSLPLTCPARVRNTFR